MRRSQPDLMTLDGSAAEGATVHLSNPGARAPRSMGHASEALGRHCLRYRFGAGRPALGSCRPHWSSGVSDEGEGVRLD